MFVCTQLHFKQFKALFGLLFTCVNHHHIPLLKDAQAAGFCGLWLI